MPRVDLADLELFRHVAEAGSITAGAGRAHLALAAASARLRGMEAVLGTVLMERSRGGIALTPAGHALLAHARELLAAAERMREAMGSYSGTAGGHVRMLSNTNALTEFLPQVLGRFLAAHPGTTVDVQERLSDEIVGLVAAGAAEVGIVAGTVDTGALRTLPFRSDRFVVVAAVAHPLAGRASVGFAELLAHDFVGLDTASALQRFLADRAAREGRRLRLRVQLRSFDAVCRMVEAGIGIGIVPGSTARRVASAGPERIAAFGGPAEAAASGGPAEAAASGGLAEVAASGGMAIVPLSDPWAARDLRVCVRDVEHLSTPARRLVEHLAADAERGRPAPPRPGAPASGPTEP